MTLKRITYTLLSLLIAIGSVAISSASIGFESCAEKTSCVEDSSDFGWLENDEESNNLDLLACASSKPKLSLSNEHLCGGQFSQLDAPSHAHSAIRAPPLSF